MRQSYNLQLAGEYGVTYAANNDNTATFTHQPLGGFTALLAFSDATVTLAAGHNMNNAPGSLSLPGGTIVPFRLSAFTVTSGGPVIGIHARCGLT